MDKYVVKFGSYYFDESCRVCGSTRLTLNKNIKDASWLTENRAIEICKEFGGEICKLNVEVNIIEEEE